MEKTIGAITKDAAEFAVNEYVWVFRAASTALRAASTAMSRIMRRFPALPIEAQLSERFKTIERAILLQTSHKPQAEVDKSEAEAAATLMKAIENVPNVAIQAGSLLLIKVTHKDGHSSVHVRNLDK